MPTRGLTLVFLSILVAVLSITAYAILDLRESSDSRTRSWVQTSVAVTADMVATLADSYKSSRVVEELAQTSSQLKVGIAVIDRRTLEVVSATPQFPSLPPVLLKSIVGNPHSGPGDRPGFRTAPRSVVLEGDRYVVAAGQPGSGNPASITDSPFVYLASAKTDSTSAKTTHLVLIVLAAEFFGVGLLFFIMLRTIVSPVSSLAAAAFAQARNRDYLPFRTDGFFIAPLATSLNLLMNDLNDQVRTLTRERNERETILTSMVEGVILLDGALRIRTLNAAAARMFQNSTNDSIGRTLLDFGRNTALVDFAERVRGTVLPLEQSITLYRATLLHVQVHGISLSGPGKTEVLLVLNDITRLKQLELVRKDFVSNVSHELKTPVTSIKGFVETLLDNEETDPETRNRFLSIILKHADRIHSIIEDLLSLARLEQNESPIETRENDVKTIIQASTELCSSAANAGNIWLSEEYSDYTRARVNESLLQQAVTNLIDNAVKYSPKGSHVEIRVEATPEELVISVIDNGAGIPAKDIPRIFERFYRVDRARSRDIGGTGLGLAIVKHIAIAHGGEVTVDSELGRGSTFTIRIPQHQSPRQ